MIADLLTALAPGTLFLAFAGAVHVTLRRWWEGVPGPVFGAFLIVVFAFFARPLLFGDVLLPLNLLRFQPVFQDLEVAPGPGGYVDQADLVEDFPAYFSQVRLALARGEWPLLARAIGAGEPLLANSQAQVLHPFHLLTYALPLPSIFGVHAALRVFTCLYFTFLVLRRFGVSVPAASGGAMAFGTGGFLMHYLGWPQANSAAALPLLLYALECAIRGAFVGSRSYRADTLLLTFAVFFLVTGGHPETVVYVGAMSAAYALERCVRLARCASPEVAVTSMPAVSAGREKGKTAARGWGRAALRLGFSGVVGVALTAPTLLPSLEAVERSERKFRVEQGIAQYRDSSFSQALRRDLEAPGRQALLQRTLPVLFPLAYGSERFGRSWGYATSIQEGSAFAGTACLLVLAWWLMVASGGRARALQAERLELPRPPWTVMGAAAVGLVFHLQPPGLVWLMKHLPVLSQSGSHNRRLNLLLCFGLASLAAFAWDRVALHRLASSSGASRRAGSGLRGRLGAGRLVLMSAGMTLLLWWIYRSAAHPENPAAQALPRLMTLQLQMMVIALLTATVVVWRSGDFRGDLQGGSASTPGGVVVWTFAALLAVELFLLHSPLQQASPREHFFPQRPAISFLQENLGDDRMIGLGGYFLQNLPAPYGLDDARSGSPLQPIDLQLLTRRVRRATTSRDFVKADDQVLNLLGVRYVVTGEARPVPAFMPRRFAGNVEIYERPEALPRLFLIKNARSSRGLQPHELPELTQNFRVHGFVDEIPAKLRHSQHGDWRALWPETSSVEIAAIAPAHLRATARIQHPSLLGSSQYQDGGWLTLVNGLPAQRAVTNGLFVGAWLQPGAQQIDLVYRPRSFLWGCCFAAVAAALGLALWLPSPRASR